MNYLKGSRCSEIIQTIIAEKNLPTIPYFLVTAIEGYLTTSDLEKKSITKILNKPLGKQEVTQILKEYINK
jgi:hypothetical protein